MDFVTYEAAIPDNPKLKELLRFHEISQDGLIGDPEKLRERGACKAARVTHGGQERGLHDPNRPQGLAT